MVKLDLKGIIMQPMYQNAIFEGSILFEGGRNFEGGLSDVWGDSRVDGVLSEEKKEMTFRKRYNHGKGTIFYSFKKEGDIWVGGYRGEHSGIGEAQCELYDGRPKVNWDKRKKTEIFSMETAEANARFLIDQLVEEGFLKKYKHPQTGEDMIESTGKQRFDPEDN